MSSALGARATTLSASRHAAAEVRAAIAFLTRVPVAPSVPGLTGAGAFGLVGSLLGVVGGLLVLVLGDAASLAAGALAVGAIALVNGALHLDGLGDTFDALAAPSRETAEAARRDPRLGSAGVVAVGTVLVADAALLGQLVGSLGVLAAALACVVAAAASRSLAVVTAWLHRRATRPGGAAWFATRLSPASIVFSAVTAAVVAIGSSLVLASPVLLVGAIGGSSLGILGSAAIARARGGLDGDGIGASVEIAFTAVLLVVVLAA